jgi:hypothetical protein
MRSTAKKKATKKTATKKTAKVSPEPRRAPRRPKEAEPRASPAAPAAVPVAGAVPAGSLDTSFGALTLPLLPPVSPMEASVAEALPPASRSAVISPR